MMKKIVEKLLWKAWGKITLSVIYFVALDNMTVITMYLRERSERVNTRLLARERFKRTMKCCNHWDLFQQWKSCPILRTTSHPNNVRQRQVPERCQTF